MNNSLQQYFSEQTLSIPQIFKDQFIYNYEHRNEWAQSDKLYDWFGHIHYKRYDDFTKQIEKQLTIELEYSLVRLAGGAIGRGGHNKKILLVSQSGIKQMIMLSDKQTRRYYTQLEELLFNYIDKVHLQGVVQLQESQRQLEEVKQQFEQVQKTGYIYGLKHKKYGSMDYVGFTTITPKDRLDSHMSGLISSIKIPFYKCIIIQAFDNYELITIETIQYYNEQELRDREIYFQLFYESIQESKKMKCQKCKRTYQQFKSFENHRKQCYGENSLSI